MALTNKEALTRSDALYDKYVQPLEKDHWGKFVAVAPDGRTLLGSNPYKIDMEAWNAFGDEAVMFEVGARARVKPAPIPPSNAEMHFLLGFLILSSSCMSNTASRLKTSIRAISLPYPRMAEHCWERIKPFFSTRRQRCLATIF